MNSPDTRTLLSKYLNSGQKKSAQRLERTQTRCHALTLSSTISEDAFDNFENLTTRYVRLADILLQILFRLIDQMMLESPCSIIDMINRAKKLGLCDAQKMQSIRELRNAIAHE
jgi:hypothetical protein